MTVLTCLRSVETNKDKDKCFIINRAPTDTCVYNDSKDLRAVITEVYICKIYTTIKQGLASISFAEAIKYHTYLSLPQIVCL